MFTLRWNQSFKCDNLDEFRAYKGLRVEILEEENSFFKYSLNNTCLCSKYIASSTNKLPATLSQTVSCYKMLVQYFRRTVARITLIKLLQRNPSSSRFQSQYSEQQSFGNTGIYTHAHTCELWHFSQKRHEERNKRPGFDPRQVSNFSLCHID